MHRPFYKTYPFTLRNSIFHAPKQHLLQCVSACFAALLLAACAERKPQRIVTPWGEVITDSLPESVGFAVSDIVNNGEMIILTMSGPDTYYDYRGRGMGTQYLLCEMFARKMGVSLRVELCKDTAEMVSRLAAGDGDIIAFPLPKARFAADSLLFCGAGVDSLGVQWAVAAASHELADSLDAWFRPEMLAQAASEQRQMFAARRVKRRVYAPFLDRKSGVISHYDHLFKKYAPGARWDWRLMAAQCYQESCFDPQARSWAGACGLMQIMPSTADHLGLPRTSIFNPEQNVRAAAKYLAELSGHFRAVANAEERRLFVLAAYNGGYFHVQDAMALARKNGKNPHRWRDVAYYLLALENPRFYNDPVVRNGYMRGSETVDYVDRIRQRYAQYRGVPYSGASVSGHASPRQPDQYSPFTPQKAKKEHRFHID